MKTTHHFEKLDDETKEIILKYGEREAIDPYVMQRLDTEMNRSIIYEITGKNIILKKILPKGVNDEDINALIDLDGIEYFPKLYAYKERQYLFMEKAQGISLPDIINSGVTKAELRKIKELLIDAFGKMLDRKRRDWDFKLEHIFWSEENNKLTWIDLGLCDKHPLPYPSKEDELQEFEKELKRSFRSYGVKIDEFELIS